MKIGENWGKLVKICESSWKIWKLEKFGEMWRKEADRLLELIPATISYSLWKLFVSSSGLATTTCQLPFKFFVFFSTPYVQSPTLGAIKRRSINWDLLLLTTCHVWRLSLQHFYDELNLKIWQWILMGWKIFDVIC